MKKENRAIVLAIAFSESSLNYNVKHPDRLTHGIGGIKTGIHKLKHNANSLLGIEELWVRLMKANKGNFTKSLKMYKGTVRNYKSFNITMNLYRKLIRH